MVAVRGRTYRIVRTAHCHFDVFSADDAAYVGAFRSRPRLELWPLGGVGAPLREIALAAIEPEWPGAA